MENPKTATISPSTVLRKRQQISNANRTMFIWIAGVSAIVGVALVVSIFLVQKIVFGEKVLNEKRHTVSVLENNIKVIPSLKDNISVLNTNENLASVLLNDTDPPVQSVLDALPASPNATALGSSLQKKLLAGVPGVAIESINVDPVTGADAQSDPNSPSSIKFSFSVSISNTAYSGPKEFLQKNSGLIELLQKIEKSIRPFNITNLTVEGQPSKVIMMAEGVGYYQPAQSLVLRDKVVKP
ncbi:MAG: hypothetical protein QG549_446 [Patescibacteria group bacterium]|nr:hypothetical protein [Patescibacteria group bacterium]